jgi:enoyl-CoA hydratase
VLIDQQRMNTLMTEPSDEMVAVHEAVPGVRQVTINRPDRRNALNIEVKNRVADAVEAFDADASAHVLVITGAGVVFAAGSDIAEMLSLTPIEHSLQVTDRMFTALRRCTKPVIAAVEGYALGGGCELAMSCDMIIAGEGARFAQPEVRLGVIPGAGGTQRLLRTIGRYQTMRLLLTGEMMPAPQAFTMGLVSEVTPDGQALPRALEVAVTIAAMPPLAVRVIKEVVQAGADVPLDTALLLERKAFQVLFDSDDQKEGMQAFLEKRRPRYLGR